MPGIGDADLGPTTVTLLVGIIGTGEGALDPIGEGPREDDGMPWNGDWLRPLASLFCAAAKATLPSDWGGCGMGDALLGGSGLFIAGWFWPKNLIAERTNDCLFMPMSLAPWLVILLAEISPAKRGVQRSKVRGEVVVVVVIVLSLPHRSPPLGSKAMKQRHVAGLIDARSGFNGLVS